MQAIQNIHFRSLCLLLMVVVSTSGCASQYAPQTTQVDYYPQCYAPLTNLRQAEHSTESSMAIGAVFGALLGAVGGYAISGKAEGAAIGAVAGAGVGAASGHAVAASNEKERLFNLVTQLEGDISNVDEVSAAGRVAVQCYDKEFRRALEDYKAKRISRAELDSRYAEIVSGTREAMNIMGMAIDNARQREGQYVAAIDEAAREANVAPPVRTVASSKPVKNTSKAPAKPKPVTASSAPEQQVQAAAQRSDNLTQSRQKLEKEVSEADSLMLNWEADLATIRS